MSTPLFDLLERRQPPRFRTSCGVPSPVADGHCTGVRAGVVTIEHLDGAGVWQPKCWQPTCAAHRDNVIARLTDLSRFGWLGTVPTRVVVQEAV